MFVSAATAIEDAPHNLLGDHIALPWQWIFCEKQTKSREIAQRRRHSRMCDRKSTLIFGQQRIVFRPDPAPDKIANGVGQTFSSYSRNDFAENRCVAARVGPGFARLTFALKRAEKGEQVAASHGPGEIRRAA